MKLAKKYLFVGVCAATFLMSAPALAEEITDLCPSAQSTCVVGVFIHDDDISLNSFAYKLNHNSSFITVPVGEMIRLGTNKYVKFLPNHDRYTTYGVQISYTFNGNPKTCTFEGLTTKQYLRLDKVNSVAKCSKGNL